MKHELFDNVVFLGGRGELVPTAQPAGRPGMQLVTASLLPASDGKNIGTSLVSTFGQPVILGRVVAQEITL